MRGVGVNPLDVRRVTVFFSFIERTSTEAAEQTPRPRAGSAQAAGATNGSGQVAVTHTDRTRRELAASCSRSNRSDATSIRAGGDAPDTRDLFVKPGSERPFYTTVHR